MIPAIHHPRLPVRLLGTLAVLLTMSAHAQGQPARQAAPSPAPGGNGLSVNIVTDTLKNKKYGKADDTFASYVYEVTPTSDGWKVELESKEVRGVWKGSDTLVELAWKDKGYFEESSQFAPAFLVAELRNDSPRAVQIAEAYLDVAESTTDRQPYLEIHSGLDLLCKGSDYDPKVELRNYGWGDVRNPRLVFSFSLKDARSPEFLAPLPAFDQRGTTTVEEALRKSGVNVAKLKAGKFKCPSKAQVPGCLGKLKDDLGDLTKYVRTDGTAVLADVTGRIEYEWTGTDGKSHERQSPFKITIPVLQFDIGIAAECGAPGPVERDEKTIALRLDAKDYRVPLNWNGSLALRGQLRKQVSLTAPKASRHVFTIVLRLADGNAIKSKPIALSYFTPRAQPPLPDDEGGAEH